MFVGADVDQLRSLATQFDEQAGKFSGIAVEASHAIMAAQWMGTRVDGFRSDWNRRCRPSLQHVAAALRSLARALRAEADAQEQTSAVATSSTARLVADRAAVEEAPGNVRGVIADLKDLQAEKSLYSIREVVGEDGKTRLIISLPGTKGAPLDFSNWGQVGGWGDNRVYMTKDSAALRAVVAEIRTELANYPDAEVMMVGYSQGGMLAQLVAASGGFNVTEVLTVGSPRLEDLDFGDINVTRMEHNADPIVNLTDLIDWGKGGAVRDFVEMVDGRGQQNEEVNFRRGSPFEDDVHELGSGDYEWLADQFENSDNPSHAAARARLDNFLDGTVVDVSYVATDGSRTRGPG